MAEKVTDEALLKKAPRKAATKATPAKAPAKRKPAAAKPAAKAAPKLAVVADSGEKATRNKLGPQGWLQTEMVAICEEYESGKLKVEDDKPLTPHRIALIVAERGHPQPSSGAVAAALARWKDYGFVILTEKPVAFKKMTANGKKKGLDALVEAHRKAAWASKKSAD